MEDIETLAYYYYQGLEKIDLGNGMFFRLNRVKCAELMKFYGIIGLDYNRDCVIRKYSD